MYRRIDKSLLCVGAITVYSCAIYPMYYNVTVAWALIYLVTGFASPLPWASSNEDFVDKCSGHVSRAEQFLRINVLASFDDNCVGYEDASPVTFSLYAFLGQLGVWITVYFCVFKGTQVSGYIVWVTVPLPVIFVICMIINGSQLEGAGDGINAYFHGTGENTTLGQ